MSHNPFVMKGNENALWLSIILLTYLGITVERHYLMILIFWVVIIVAVGNAKRFFSERHFILSIILRRSMYVLPFLLPIMFGYNPLFLSENILLLSLLGMILGFLFILPKWKEWRIVLSQDMIEFSRKQRRSEYFTEVYMLLGAAIAEELFFRDFIIGNMNNNSYLIPIILSSFLFLLNHFGVKWYDSFKLYDYIIQIIFGVIGALLFIISKSIIPCILMHIIYNFPPALLSMKRYLFHYGNNNNIVESHSKEEL